MDSLTLALIVGGAWCVSTLLILTLFAAASRADRAEARAMGETDAEDADAPASRPPRRFEPRAEGEAVDRGEGESADVASPGRRAG
jgi:hypothetical protein